MKCLSSCFWIPCSEIEQRVWFLNGGVVTLSNWIDLLDAVVGLELGLPRVVIDPSQFRWSLPWSSFAWFHGGCGRLILCWSVGAVDLYLLFRYLQLCLLQALLGLLGWRGVLIILLRSGTSAFSWAGLVILHILLNLLLCFLLWLSLLFLVCWCLSLSRFLGVRCLQAFFSLPCLALIRLSASFFFLDLLWSL